MTSVDASAKLDGANLHSRSDAKIREAIALAQASVDRYLAGEGSEPQGTDPEGVSAEDRADLAELAAALDILGEYWSGPLGGSDPTDGPPLKLSRFEILEERGRGGFGIVLRAFDPLLQRDVALKIPRPERLIAGHPADEFVREAQVAARLEHPGIVRVYETQRLGPIWYIASAYCDGPTLAEWLQCRTKPLPPRQAAQLVSEVAEAIHYAHTRGVLHLDIKPENILLEERGPSELPRPSVTDFGLAGRRDDSNSDRTPRIAGTLAYMAPEQRTGDIARIGTATDVYALGAILYDILNLHCLDNRSGTTSRTIATEPFAKVGKPPARTPLTSIPRNLDAICQKCLRDDPTDRYESPRELAVDLGRFMRGQSVAARQAPWNERIGSLIRRRPIVTSLCAILTPTFIIGLTAITLFWREAESSLAGYRAEQARHTETSRQMSQALLSLTRITQEVRLQPQLAYLEEEMDIRLLQGVYRDIQAWTDDVGDQMPHGKALQAADHSLALVHGMDHLENPHRNDAFLAGATAWNAVIQESPDQPQWRRALALHMLTYAADFPEPKWLWWREPEATDAMLDNAVAELALDDYALLLVELACKRVRLRQHDAADAMLRAAITLLEERQHLPDPTFDRCRTALVAYTALATVREIFGHHDWVREILSKGEALASNAPSVDQCPPVLAVAVGELHKARAKFFAKQKDDVAALAAFGLARPYLARATELLPQQVSVRLSLVHLLERTAKIHISRDQLQEATDCYRAAIDSLDAAIAEFPGHRSLIGRRGRAQALLSWQLLAVNNSVDAQVHLEAAFRDFTSFELSDHDSTAQWMQAIRCLQALGKIYAEQGLDLKAMESHQKAVVLLERLRPRRGRSGDFMERLNESRAALAQLASEPSGLATTPPGES